MGQWKLEQKWLEPTNMARIFSQISVVVLPRWILMPEPTNMAHIFSQISVVVLPSHVLVALALMHSR